MDPKDFLFFDKLIMPKVITVLYWLSLAACVIAGLVTMFTVSFFGGIGVIIGGAIIMRLYSELVIVFFKINEALQEMRQRP